MPVPAAAPSAAPAVSHLWPPSAWFAGLDRDLGQWLLALAVTLAVYLAATLALGVAARRLQRVAARSRTRVDDVLLDIAGATSHGLIALAAGLVGLGLLDLDVRWQQRIDRLWFIAVALQLALWGQRAIRLLPERVLRHEASGTATHAGITATLILWALRSALWAVVLLAILSNLGVNITAFVASLGVGGIAVALAVQNVLGDLINSLSIAVDKPFEVGDFITFGDVAGTVEHVGLKSTRIRSLGGEQIITANGDLLKQTIHNYKRQAERRVLFAFRLTYGTTPDQAAAATAAVRRIIESRPQLRFDRAHFKGFGESALDYEVVYFVRVADFNTYMDEQQAINLALMRAFADLGVGFAFPTRTVRVDGPLPPLDGAAAAPSGAANGHAS
jgi:small-conductance mechanosensitive channel